MAARSFLNPTVAAQVKAAQPKADYGQDFRDKVALGTAIGQCNRAGLTREATKMALIGLTDDQKEIAIARWEANRKAYNLPFAWAVEKASK